MHMDVCVYSDSPEYAPRHQRSVEVMRHERQAHGDSDCDRN